MREVLAFDDGGVALIVDETGGRLVPVGHLSDGWEFTGLASRPRPRAFRFEGVIREVEATDELPEPEDDEPRWCEARPPQPEVTRSQENDDDEEATDD